MEKPLHVATPSGADTKKLAAAKPSSDGTADAQEPHVTWDEETIAQHDLERGTRMKIDEPDTPYHYYAGSDMQAEDMGSVSPARSLSGKEGKQPIEWDELQEKLQNVKETKKSDWDSSDDESSSVSSASSGRRAAGAAAAAGGIAFAERDAEGKKIRKDPKFAEKRKMHYNEFERVRAWKMQHASEDEDEDEAEEDEAKASATSAAAKPTQ